MQNSDTEIDDDEWAEIYKQAKIRRSSKRSQSILKSEFNSTVMTTNSAVKMQYLVRFVKMCVNNRNNRSIKKYLSA